MTVFTAAVLLREKDEKCSDYTRDSCGGGITSAGAESESDFKLSSTYHRKPKDEAEWKFC